MKRIVGSILFGCAVLFFGVARACAQEIWLEDESVHFIARYQDPGDRQWVSSVLREAERYYRSIAEQIGYARYRNFWTWDSRVQITIYATRQAFIDEGEQPEWSQGTALRHQRLAEQKEIVTYKQEQGFLDGVLPHEISHLMLRDFLGEAADIPVWFDEGVAQLRESGKRDMVDVLLQPVVQQRGFISFDTLMTTNIRGSTDPQYVAIFYAQSLSIVDFLISRYGSARFGELCRLLKNGKTFEEALKQAYTATVDSLNDLELKWVQYMATGQ